MKTIKQLNTGELFNLYNECIIMREKVLTFVQEFEDMDANKLVSMTFQHEIEKEYGRKMLKELSKEKTE